MPGRISGYVCIYDYSFLTAPPFKASCSVLVVLNKHKLTNAMEKAKLQEYWKINLGYLIGLLVVWFVVSYGFGILLVEPLNTIRLGGFKLGFWFAQQGSIYVFVVEIFIYVMLMNKLDKRFDVHED